MFFLFFSGNNIFAQFDNYRIDQKIEIRYGLYEVRLKNNRLDLHPLIIPYEWFAYSVSEYIAGYEQYGDILFFKNKSFEKNMIYDKLGNEIVESNIDKIESVVFVEQNKLIINGYYTVNRRGFKITNMDDEYRFNDYNTIIKEVNEQMTISYINRNTQKEIIGQYIQQNSKEGQSELFIYPIERKGKNQFLFNLFGKNIQIDCSNYRIDYDSINVTIVYNTLYNSYFLFVDSYKGDH
jgi:hypothetical protein